MNGSSENRLMNQSTLAFLILMMGIGVLLLSIWGGLIRVGWWDYKLTIKGLPGIHGPLVVSGFLGTFFSLERALSLKYKWGYLVPLAVVLGSFFLLLDPMGKSGRFVITIGSFGLLVLCMVSLQKQINFFNSMIALGTVFWLSGMIIWLVDWPVFNIYLWWMGFVLFTIVGQRLELAHRMKLGSMPIAPLGMTLAFLLLGLLLMAVGHQTAPDTNLTIHVDGIYDSRLILGMRLAGIGMLGTGIWLLKYDASWSLIRNGGMAGYIAVCFISSYLWLILSGLFSIIFAGIVSGVRYDAVIHTFFIGFVLFAIFGHTPSMLLYGIGVRFKKINSFFFHVILLHFSLLVRISADVFRYPAMQKWGGMLNALAILFFILGTTYWIIKELLETREIEASSKANLSV